MLEQGKRGLFDRHLVQSLFHPPWELQGSFIHAIHTAATTIPVIIESESLALKAEYRAELIGLKIGR